MEEGGRCEDSGPPSQGAYYCSLLLKPILDLISALLGASAAAAASAFLLQRLAESLFLASISHLSRLSSL